VEEESVMELSAVLGFAVVALTLIVVPGPDWAYVLAVGSRDHVVVPVVTGVLLGYVVVTAVVAAGVGPLIASVPLALVALTVGGAGYLIYLGVRTLRSSGRLEPLRGGVAQAASSSRYLLRGVGVSALNPKGLLLFLSILPQFTRPDGGWPVPLQLATLGGVFILCCAIFYVPLGYASGRIFGTRPRAAGFTTRIAGAAMVVVGAALLAERLIETFWH
jgi:threonine/homoserine/homoserine lactone efflux protein